jgi:hypothetical protein
MAVTSPGQKARKVENPRFRLAVVILRPLFANILTDANVLDGCDFRPDQAFFCPKRL